MNGDTTRRDLTVPSGDVTLAGTLWLPGRAPIATVLMHPGSGPSDRDNDVYFPPIREHLLAHDIAVCSFDKRGVGGSTGRWEQAAIGQQADDALAAVDALLANVSSTARLGSSATARAAGSWSKRPAEARTSRSS